MTSELIFLIFLVLKFTTVISKNGGKTRAVRKPFLHHFYKGGDISDCLLFALAPCGSWLLGGGGGEWVRS